MTQEQIMIEALRLKAMKSPLTIEQLVAFVEKRESKKGNISKSSVKGFERRESTEKMNLQPLWGHGTKFSDQAEYQRSCLGSKWN